MPETKSKAKNAVHLAAVAASGVALSPIPFSDAFLIIPIQTKMIMDIYKAYGKQTSEGLINGVVKSTLTTQLGRSAATNLMKLVPGVGTIAGAALGTVVAGGLTEVIGNSIIEEFESGNTVDIEDLSRIIINAFKTVQK